MIRIIIKCPLDLCFLCIVIEAALFRMECGSGNEAPFRMKASDIVDRTLSVNTRSFRHVPSAGNLSMKGFIFSENACVIDSVGKNRKILFFPAAPLPDRSRCFHYQETAYHHPVPDVLPFVQSHSSHGCSLFDGRRRASQPDLD